MNVPPIPTAYTYHLYLPPIPTTIRIQEPHGFEPAGYKQPWGGLPDAKFPPWMRCALLTLTLTLTLTKFLVRLLVGGAGGAGSSTLPLVERSLAGPEEP